MQRRDFLASVLASSPLAAVAYAGGVETPRLLRIATFRADVTPPLGSPLCLGFVRPAREIMDRLDARGIILFAGGPPIVLCAVDWCLIANAGYDVWCQTLAEAVGTTTDRVSVHCVHQHNAQAVDFTAGEILTAHGLSGKMFDVADAYKAIKRVAKAAGQAVKGAQPVTHLGYGLGRVEKVASTRRVLTPDGKLRFWRGSGGGTDEMKAAPEGLIDPYVRLLSFWDDRRPLASMTYYACHPCAIYGRGGISSEVPGIARSARDAALPGVMNIHFNGAGGDIAVGKYNDNTPATRPRLAERLAAGMKLAWETQKKAPVTADDVNWRIRPVILPIQKSITEQNCLQMLRNAKGNLVTRIRGALDLAHLQRVRSGHRLAMNCLRIGPARLLHMQGELFVKYQLSAQQMRPDDFVCMAAYGNLAPGYVGTKIAYSQGGYEVASGMCRTTPEVEDVLMQAIRELLDR